MIESLIELCVRNKGLVLLATLLVAAGDAEQGDE